MLNFWPFKKKPSVLQVLFNLSMILKGIDGVLELAGGLIFIILKKREILDATSHFLHYNMFSISDQRILEIVQKASTALTTNIHIFISIILICNGVIKIVLAANLILRKMIAFPIAIIFLLVLLLYQIIETIYNPSIYLYLFNLFDAIVILVIWLEYRHLKKI